MGKSTSPQRIPVKGANMKTKKKLKSQTKHRKACLPLGMQKTHEVSKSHFPKEIPTNTYSPKEIGGPDADNVPDIRNPQAV